MTIFDRIRIPCRRFLLAIAFSSLSSAAAFSAGILPRPPQSPKTFDVPFALPTAGKTIYVNQGGDLQAAFDSSLPGDVVVLQAGATFTGNFKLPQKTGNGWIYIVSSDLNSLPAGQRVGPAAAAHMPKIISPNDSPALFTNFAAHNYRFAGIEFSTAAANYNLVLLGWGLDNYSDPLWAMKVATSVSKLPYNITFDRCYLHSTSEVNYARTGINADGKYIAVVDSYLENFKDGADSQAIQVWNGEGPFKIVNNYLESAGENVMFGGTDPQIANLVPADIEIRGNYFTKRNAWRAGKPGYNGRAWSVKNLFELKNARRILLCGNIFENNWGDSGQQRATAIVFTVRNQGGKAPWSVIEDVAFENNIIRDVGIGLRLTGQDDVYPSGQTQRISIHNNLWENIRSDYYDGNTGFSISTARSIPVRDLTITHNLIFFPPSGKGYMLAYFGDSGKVAENCVIDNNIFMHGNYGITGNGTGVGLPSLNHWLSNYSFKNNIVISRTVDQSYKDITTGFAGYYGPKNFNAASLDAVGFISYAKSNYRLSNSSLYNKRLADGTAPGPDYDALDNATKNARNGVGSLKGSSAR